MSIAAKRSIANQMRRVNVLGVGISAIDIPRAVQTIDSWITTHKQHYVCVTNVHAVMEAQKSHEFKCILNNAGLTTPDGMPMVWLGKLHGFRNISRVYGPDLMLALCDLAARKGYRNFFYGGASGVAQQLAKRMREIFPRLKTVGTFTPPFRPLTPEEDEHVVEIINKARPHIVWVGISTPKQERWMAAHMGRLGAGSARRQDKDRKKHKNGEWEKTELHLANPGSGPVMLGVGAAFDFHTGRVKQAPPWIQRSGMEWLYRVSKDPKRLWWRYLWTNPRFMMETFLQLTGLRSYHLPMQVPGT